MRSDPRHICLVTEFPIVLDGRILNQAWTLQRAGYRVTIVDQSAPVSPDPLAPLRDRLPEWATTSCRVVRLARGDEHFPVSLFMALQKPARPLARWLVSRFLRRCRADVYQARSVDTLRTVVPAARAIGAPVVYDVRDFDTPHLLRDRNTRKRRHVVAAERRAMPSVAALMTVNDTLATAVAAYYHIAPPVVVLNCKLVSSELPPGMLDLRSELGLPAATPLLVFTGTTAFARGFPLLFAALAHVPGAHLALVGIRDVSGAFQQDAAAAGVAERVSFHPPVPAYEVPAYIRSADASISSSEPVNANQAGALPNKLFEAIAAHLPLIATDIPEQRRVVEGYGVGGLFTASDPVDLSRAIGAVLADRERLRRSVIAASRELCWEREGEKVLAVYRHVIGPARAVSPVEPVSTLC